MKLSQENKLRLIGSILIVGAFSSFYDIRPTPTVLGAQSVVSSPRPLPASPHSIAHAGGMYMGKTYTNSTAALQHSYDLGFRLQEVDLNLTTDGQVVLLHDWYSTLENVFAVTPGPRDLQTFLTDTAAGPDRIAQLDDLAAWVKQHPDVRINLDSKIDAVDMLTRVASRYPELRGQFVPFIYDFRQYEPVAKLGFENIALLVHADQYTPSALLAFARNYPLYFIAMQPATLDAQLPTLPQYTHIFCWTINDTATAEHAISRGAYGIVTDSLPPQP